MVELTPFTEVRARIIDYIRAELVGPKHGAEESIDEAPHKKYLTGILYPQAAEADKEISEDDVDDTSQISTNSASSDGTDGDDTASILSNQFLPSSLGISFLLVDSPDFITYVSFGTYTKTAPMDDLASTGNGAEQRRLRKTWTRTPHTFSNIECRPVPGKNRIRVGLLEGKAYLDVVWRPSANGWLVTVSLINGQGDGSHLVDGAKCLLQPEISCRPSSKSRIFRLPRQRAISNDLEQQRLDLMYLEKAPYAAGHGCSVIWREGSDHSAESVLSSIIPEQAVPALSYDLEGFGEVLSVRGLAFEHVLSSESLFRQLDAFVDAYETWIDHTASTFGEVPHDLGNAFDDIVSRQKKAATRMRAGIGLLKSNETVLTAFRLANEAMLLQMLHSSDSFLTLLQGPFSPDEIATKEQEIVEKLRWRPFQLGFQIMTLGSVVSDEDEFRDIVDLIWFPTGGGKTEAYLAMTAVSILYRRLTAGDQGAGTAVIMRYTLRLLTSQQFERASRLICALETLRRRDPAVLGSQSVTIGLWVGDSLTPNKIDDACEVYVELLESDYPEPLFQVQVCPWCGTRMVPNKRSGNPADYGYLVEDSSFRFRCPRANCEFHDGLPLNVVDDHLYQEPPSLLLGTIDKFAGLPREPRADHFFGGLGNRPPDLIIQDELHLISGPLGSIAGLYEMALDGLIALRGYSPKVIAATATARRADEQALGLYAREAEVFPPSGLKASNSYFAREAVSQEKPGRLYLGVLAQGHSGSTAMVRVSAALLQAPIELGLTGETLDAYWTLVGYHNSLRELGKSVTFAADDIPARIRVIASDPKKVRPLHDDENVRELTSNLNGQQLSEVLYRLSHQAAHRNEISFLLSTNMLSVGVDIDRLGLMLVNGQPKSTAEYIQASSRVGRSTVPGLVVTLYSPTKPRDRSHYERFVSYHSTLYAGVEPTSVTPFSEPARDRALHAALVTLVRYLAMPAGDNSACEFNPDHPLVREIQQFITDRIRKADPREATSAEVQLGTLLAEWSERGRSTPNLLYSSWQRQFPVLMVEAIGDAREEGWPTLRSMRNVDASTPVNVVGVPQ